MKKIGFLLLAVMISAVSVNAQTVVYDDNVQKRDVGHFSSIDVSSGIEVIISKGDKEGLAVSADRKYIDEVRTIVQGGTLKVYRSEDWKLWRQWKNWRIRVYVSYTALEDMKVTSGASVTGTDVNLDKLSAKLNSGASITLSGKIRSLDVDGSSGAQFHGYSLSTVMCTAEASSGAGVQITVDKEISARASSGGFIRYKGEGLIRDINVSSGGTVKRQNNG